MNLSEHFTLEEMVRSQTALRLGIDNTPDADEIANGKRLCATILEPARAALCKATGRDIAMFTSSGFRCRALNRAVGGSATSAHLDFLASDQIPALPRGISLRVAFDVIRNAKIPYDQIILECNEWIHLAAAREGREPRRQALLAFGGPGHWKYEQAK